MRAFVTAIILVCFATDSLSGQKNDYRVVAKSKMTVDQGGNKQLLDADTVFHYSRSIDAGSAKLAVDSVKFIAKSGGRNVRNLLMKKGELRDAETGEKKPVSDAQREALKSFGEPIVEIKLDKNGAEQSRKFLVGDTSLLIKSGDYQYCNLFHTGYHPDKKEWTEQIIYPAAEGGAIKGKVKYKVLSRDDKIAKVEFKGLCDSDFVLRGLNCKNVKYEISGTKTFDNAKKIWTTGDMNVKAYLEMFLGGNKVITMSGTIKFEFGLRTKDQK